MRKRSREKELIDLKQCTEEEYFDCLTKLGRIGKFLGAEKATIRALEKGMDLHDVKTILDVGSGGGDFAARLALRYPNAKVCGLDIEEDAIEYAQAKWGTIPNLSFVRKDLYELESTSFDVVTSTLCCHHLTDEELVPFLQKMQQIATKKVVINDLQRSKIAYFLFKIISPILFPNPLIFHDGLVSITRGFVYREWQELLCHFPRKEIRWHWPFRWIVSIAV